MNNFGYGHGFGFGPVGILFWILIIGLVIWAFGQFSRQAGKRTANDPLDILKRRYARGEIDKEEYEQRRRDLEQD